MLNFISNHFALLLDVSEQCGIEQHHGPSFTFGYASDKYCSSLRNASASPTWCSAVTLETVGNDSTLLNRWIAASASGKTQGKNTSAAHSAAAEGPAAAPTTTKGTLVVRKRAMLTIAPSKLSAGELDCIACPGSGGSEISASASALALLLRHAIYLRIFVSLHYRSVWVQVCDHACSWGNTLHGMHAMMDIPNQVTMASCSSGQIGQIYPSKASSQLDFVQ